MAYLSVKDSKGNFTWHNSSKILETKYAASSPSTEAQVSAANVDLTALFMVVLLYKTGPQLESKSPRNINFFR